jgi:hypothetical protein
LCPPVGVRFTKLLRQIKKKITANKEFKKDKGRSYDFLPLTPKGERNMMLFFKPEGDEKRNKLGKYLVTGIEIRDNKLRNKK